MVAVGWLAGRGYPVRRSGKKRGKWLGGSEGQREREVRRFGDKSRQPTLGQGGQGGRAWEAAVQAKPRKDADGEDGRRTAWRREELESESTR